MTRLQACPACGLPVWHAVSFATSAVGWVVGTDARIAASADGGVSWALQGVDVAANIRGVTLRAVQAVNATIVFAVGDGDTLLRTRGVTLSSPCTL